MSFSSRRRIGSGVESRRALGSDGHRASNYTFDAQEGYICGFRTDSFRMTVSFNDDGTWSYFEDTVLQVLGRDGPFHHTDRNTLHKVAEPTPNPLARG